MASQTEDLYGGVCIDSTSDSVKFECGICLKEFSTYWCLQIHTKTHDEKRSFDCHECGKTFPKFAEFCEHLKDHVFGEDSVTEDHDVCGICGKEYPVSQIAMHKRTHIFKPGLTCETCGKSFGSSQVLKLHHRTHGNKMLYQCQICGLKFASRNFFTLHWKSHPCNELSPDSSNVNFWTEKYDRPIKNLTYSASLVKSGKKVNNRPSKNLKCRVLSPKSKAYTNVILVKKLGRYYICSVCAKQFRGRHEAEQHTVHHYYWKRLKCKSHGSSEKVKSNAKLQNSGYVKKLKSNSNKNSKLQVNPNYVPDTSHAEITKPAISEIQEVECLACNECDRSFNTVKDLQKHNDFHIREYTVALMRVLNPEKNVNLSQEQKALLNAAQSASKLTETRLFKSKKEFFQEAAAPGLAEKCVVSDKVTLPENNDSKLEHLNQVNQNGQQLSDKNIIEKSKLEKTEVSDSSTSRKKDGHLTYQEVLDQIIHSDYEMTCKICGKTFFSIEKISFHINSHLMKDSDKTLRDLPDLYKMTSVRVVLKRLDVSQLEGLGYRAIKVYQTNGKKRTLSKMRVPHSQRKSLTRGVTPPDIVKSKDNSVYSQQDSFVLVDACSASAISNTVIKDENSSEHQSEGFEDMDQFEECSSSSDVHDKQWVLSTTCLKNTSQSVNVEVVDIDGDEGDDVEITTRCKDTREKEEVSAVRSSTLDETRSTSNSVEVHSSVELKVHSLNEKSSKPYQNDLDVEDSDDEQCDDILDGYDSTSDVQDEEWLLTPSLESTFIESNKQSMKVILGDSNSEKGNENADCHVSAKERTSAAAVAAHDDDDKDDDENDDKDNENNVSCEQNTSRKARREGGEKSAVSRDEIPVLSSKRLDNSPRFIGKDLPDFIVAEKEKFRCTICDERLSSKYNAETHLKRHVRTKQLKRFHCEFKPQTRLHLAGHLKADKGQAIHQHEKLKDHRSDEHTVTYEESQCKICGQKFSKTDQFEQHKLVHQALADVGIDIKEADFNRHSNLSLGLPCPVCKKKYTTPYKLKEHVRVHTEEKKFKCDICGLSFKSSGYLITHKNIHNNVRPFPCDLCHRSFPSVNLLRSHVKRSHENRGIWRKKVSCDICGKEVVKGYLSGHKSLHKTKESFNKSKVKKILIENKSLRQTSNSDFNAQETNDSSDGVSVSGRGTSDLKEKMSQSGISCVPAKSLNTTLPSDDVCQNNISKTIKNNITNEGRKLRCNVCEKLFSDRRKIYNHVRHHLKGRQHKCEECGYMFSDRKFLIKHKESHIKQQDKLRGIPKQDIENSFVQHEGIFTCLICNFNYKNNYAVYKHVLQHLVFDRNRGTETELFGNTQQSSSHNSIPGPQPGLEPSTICESAVIVSPEKELQNESSNLAPTAQEDGTSDKERKSFDARCPVESKEVVSVLISKSPEKVDETFNNSLLSLGKKVGCLDGERKCNDSEVPEEIQIRNSSQTLIKDIPENLQNENTSQTERINTENKAARQFSSWDKNIFDRIMSDSQTKQDDENNSGGNEEEIGGKTPTNDLKTRIMPVSRSRKDDPCFSDDGEMVVDEDLSDDDRDSDYKYQSDSDCSETDDVEDNGFDSVSLTKHQNEYIIQNLVSEGKSCGQVETSGQTYARSEKSNTHYVSGELMSKEFASVNEKDVCCLLAGDQYDQEDKVRREGSSDSNIDQSAIQRSTNEQKTKVKFDESKEGRDVILQIQDNIVRVDEKYACKICKKEFGIEKKCFEHVSNHVRRNCINFECGFSTLASSYFQNHINNNQEKNLLEYPCLICQHVFSKSAFLSSHIASHSDEDKVKYLNYLTCETCGKICKNYEVYYKHKVEHLESFRCQRCSATLSSAEAFVEHVYKLKHFFCEKCGKKSSSVKNLENHQKCVHEKLTPFQCDRCGKQFFNKQMLRTHVLKVHEEIHTCRECKSTFKTKKELMDHRSHQHEFFAENRCDDCGQFFEKVSHFGQHRLLHEALAAVGIDIQKADFSRKLKLTFALTCPVCKREYSTPYQLKDHLRIHTDEIIRRHFLEFEDQVHPCRDCKASFKTAKELKDHKCDKHNLTLAENQCKICLKKFRESHLHQQHELVHQALAEAGIDIKDADFHRNVNMSLDLICPLCKKKYTTPYKLKEHVRVHTEEKKFKCDICGLSFKSNGYLITHKNIHNNVRPFPCDLCHRSFPSTHLLRAHVKKSHEKRGNHKKIVSCDICGKQVRKGSLSSHRKNHELKKHAKKFSCDLCDKKFYMEFHLKAHKKTHSNKKEFMCDICGNLLRTKHSLQEHKKGHAGLKPLQCSLCDKRFKSKAFLQKHMIVHTDKKPYVCDICNKAFRYSEVLKNHRLIHTGEKPYKCDVCGERFGDRWARHNHVKRHQVS